MNILITGASRGIGYQIVKTFVKHGTHRIIIASRDIEKLQQLKNECMEINSDNDIFPFQINLEDADEIKSNLKSFVFNHFNHLDILINNAASLIRNQFEEIHEVEAERIFKINFFSPALLIKEMIPRMGKSSPSHVINISSMAGFQGSSKYPGLSYYSASKAALASLTESLAVEFKDPEISFNCLALGAVQTEMFAEAFPGYKAPLNSETMSEFIADFALNGYKYFNGKTLPVSVSNP